MVCTQVYASDQRFKIREIKKAASLFTNHTFLCSRKKQIYVNDRNRITLLISIFGGKHTDAPSLFLWIVYEEKGNQALEHSPWGSGDSSKPDRVQEAFGWLSQA